MNFLRHKEHTETAWLALMIGNSRLHWALFLGKTLYSAWDTDYLPESDVNKLVQCQTLEDLPTGEMEMITKNFPFSSPLPLVLASVVPNQTALWQKYPHVRLITLNQVPFEGVYPTLGIDRALAVWGAGKTWGFPILVIDAGTALTFTGVDSNHHLIGGAILPGLGLQLATLANKTGQLPNVELSQQLPQRFALNTQEAMQSGVIYSLLAVIKDFIEAWWRLFPESKIAMTGGDRKLLINYFKSQYPEIAGHLVLEPNLIFWGMREIDICDLRQE